MPLNFARANAGVMITVIVQLGARRTFGSRSAR